MELERRGGDPQTPLAGEPGGAARARAGEPEPVAEADEAAPVRRLKPRALGRRLLWRERSTSARDTSHTGAGVRHGSRAHGPALCGW